MWKNFVLDQDISHGPSIKTMCMVWCPPLSPIIHITSHRYIWQAKLWWLDAHEKRTSPLPCKCVTGATVRVQQKPLVAPPPGMWQKGMKIHWSVESPKTSHWMAHLKNKEGALIVGLKQMSKFQQLAKTRVMTISPEKGLPKVRMFQFLLLYFLFSCSLLLLLAYQNWAF